MVTPAVVAPEVPVPRESPRRRDPPPQRRSFEPYASWLPLSDVLKLEFYRQPLTGKSCGQRRERACVDERPLCRQIQYGISARCADFDICDLPVSLDQIFHRHGAGGVLVLIPVLANAVDHVGDV